MSALSLSENPSSAPESAGALAVVQQAPLEAEAILGAVSTHYLQLAPLYPQLLQDTPIIRRRKIKEALSAAAPLLVGTLALMLLAPLLNISSKPLGALALGISVCTFGLALCFGVKAYLTSRPWVAHYHQHQEMIARAIFMQRISPMSTEDIWNLANDEDIDYESPLTADWLSDAAKARPDFPRIAAAENDTAAKLEHALASARASSLPQVGNEAEDDASDTL